MLVAALALALASCGMFRKKAKTKAGVPKVVAVLPVSNQSGDITAAVLVRFFLEKHLPKKGFVLNVKFKAVDTLLHQLGISDGNQIRENNIRQIGQMLKVDGVFHAQLLEFRFEPLENRTVIRAKFELTEMRTGKILWERESEIEKKGMAKVPIRGVVTSDWSMKQVRAIARGQAGELPEKLVREALKTVPH